MVHVIFNFINQFLHIGYQGQILPLPLAYREEIFFFFFFFREEIYKQGKSRSSIWEDF